MNWEIASGIRAGGQRIINSPRVAPYIPEIPGLPP